MDPELFEDIPPKLCKGGLGGALMRIGCDHEGYPVIEDTTTPEPARWRGQGGGKYLIFTSENIRNSPRDPVSGTDVRRAEEKVPRGHYKVDGDRTGCVL